jgi:hypothetical protein
MEKISVRLFVITMLVLTSVWQATSEKQNIENNDNNNISHSLDEYPLPTPIEIDMVLEESIKILYTK